MKWRVVADDSVIARHDISLSIHEYHVFQEALKKLVCDGDAKPEIRRAAERMLEGGKGNDE